MCVCVCCGSSMVTRLHYAHAQVFLDSICVCVSLSRLYTGFWTNAEQGTCLQLLSKASEVIAGRGCRQADISVRYPSRTPPTLHPSTDLQILPTSRACFSLASWIEDWNKFFPGHEARKKLTAALRPHHPQREKNELKEPLYSAPYSSTPLYWGVDFHATLAQRSPSKWRDVLPLYTVSSNQRNGC